MGFGDWGIGAYRSVKLALKSVNNNAPMRMAVKQVFTVGMLEELVLTSVAEEELGDVMGFFRFFRLSTLVPPNSKSFDKTCVTKHVQKLGWATEGLGYHAFKRSGAY